MRSAVINKSKNSVDMLSGPLVGKLIVFAMPIALTGILQQLFNSADVVICGRFVGNVALAAVGANSHIVNLFVGSFIGLSIGANVLIANYIGAGKIQKIHNVVTTSMTFAVLFGLTLMFIGLIFAKSLLSFLGTPDEIIEPATLYLKILFIGIPFIVVYNFGTAILRSIGDTRRPLIILSITGLLNVVLNVFFVVAFKMGVEGVAIATVIANSISAIVVVFLLTRETSDVKYNIGEFMIVKDSLLKIMVIGIPSAIQGMVFSISNLCVQTAVNSLGTKTIAANTAAFNIESFPYFLLSAFASACLTFMSQNFGAENYDRCRVIVKDCLILAIAFSGSLILIIGMFPRQVLSLFTKDVEVIGIALYRIYIVCIPNWISSVYEILSAGIRVLKHPMISAVIIMLGTVVFRFIWVLLVFPLNRTYAMLLYVYPLSWIIINVIITIAYLRISKAMLPRM